MQTASDIYYHGPVIVFDLDDTLYSEYEHAVGAYRAVCSMSDLCHPKVRKVALEAMTGALERGENPFDSLEESLAAAGFPSLATVHRRLNVYRHFKPSALTLYPDAKDVLNRLRERNIRMAIVTDGRSFTQSAKIRALGIEDFFHPADILISGETGHDKSEPDNFTAIVHHYPEASRFVYIGDNPARDFDVPLSLGWETFCLRSRKNNIHPQTAEALAAIPETRLIDSLNDVADTL